MMLQPDWLKKQSLGAVVSILLIIMQSAGAAETVVPSPRSVPPPAPLDCSIIESVLEAPQDYVILDARSPSEYDSGHVSGALNVPYDSVPGYVDVLPGNKQQPIITYCRSGRRATVLKNLLTEMGYTDIHVVPGEQMDRDAAELSFKCGN